MSKNLQTVIIAVCFASMVTLFFWAVQTGRVTQMDAPKPPEATTATIERIRPIIRQEIERSRDTRQIKCSHSRCRGGRPGISGSAQGSFALMPRHDHGRRNKRAKRTSPGVIARHIEEANVQPLLKGRIGTAVDMKMERVIAEIEMATQDEQQAPES